MDAWVCFCCGNVKMVRHSFAALLHSVLQYFNHLRLLRSLTPPTFRDPTKGAHFIVGTRVLMGYVSSLHWFSTADFTNDDVAPRLRELC